MRVTKPRLPPAIEANYEAMEAERTRVGVARERALVVTQEAETEHRRAVMIVRALHLSTLFLQLSSIWCRSTCFARDVVKPWACIASMQAEKEAETSRIHMQQLLAERQAEQMRETIQNEMYLAKQRMLADSDYYRCESYKSLSDGLAFAFAGFLYACSCMYAAGFREQFFHFAHIFFKMGYAVHAGQSERLRQIKPNLHQSTFRWLSCKQ